MKGADFPHPRIPTSPLSFCWSLLLIGYLQQRRLREDSPCPCSISSIFSVHSNRSVDSLLAILCEMPFIDFSGRALWNTSTYCCILCPLTVLDVAAVPSQRNNKRCTGHQKSVMSNVLQELFWDVQIQFSFDLPTLHLLKWISAHISHNAFQGPDSCLEHVWACQMGLGWVAASCSHLWSEDMQSSFIVTAFEIRLAHTLTCYLPQ